MREGQTSLMNAGPGPAAGLDSHTFVINFRVQMHGLQHQGI